MYLLISITFPFFVIHIHSLVFITHLRGIPYGLAVRIPGFHPGGPGSTPGMGTPFLRVQTLQAIFLVSIKH